MITLQLLSQSVTGIYYFFQRLVVKAPFTDTLLKLSVLVSLPQKAEHVELFLPDLGGGKMIRLTVLKIVSAYSLSKA